MATLTTRRLTNGEVRFVVRWTAGGGRRGPDKKQDSGTLDNENQAIRFKLDVEDAGHVFPKKKWIKDEYGYVVPATDPLARNAASTFALVADKYFERMRKRVTTNKVKSFTVHRYERMYDIHLKPTFGDLDFTAIEVEDVEEWIHDQHSTGLSAKSIRNQHGLLYSIMGHGQKRLKLRHDNPCEASADELPERTDGKKRQVMFFLREEWKQFRAHLEPDVHLMCDVMLASGMRCGEAMALRAGDVIINSPSDVSIRIERAWGKRGPYNKATVDRARGETETWHISTPKSGAARWSNIKGDVAQDLIAHIEGLDPEKYIFTRTSGVPWRYPDFHYERWAPARRKAGLTRIVPKPHMLRHSFVVWSLNGGKDIYQVSSAVGHASIQVTQQVYSGHIDPTRNSVADVMQEQMDDLHQFVIHEDDDGAT